MKVSPRMFTLPMLTPSVCHRFRGGAHFFGFRRDPVDRLCGGLHWVVKRPLLYRGWFANAWGVFYGFYCLFCYMSCGVCVPFLH
jgi:hypothetical protein